MHDLETGDDAIPPKREGDESPNVTAQKQQEYEAAYREQQQRRSCPDCGEEPFSF